MTDLSLFRWSEFQTNPGEHYNNFAMGASQFVNDVLVRPLLSSGGGGGVVLQFDSPVANINWSSEQTTVVQLRNGVHFQGQIVLVTCSIGVLQKNEVTKCVQGSISKVDFIFLFSRTPYSLRNYRAVSATP